MRKPVFDSIPGSEITPEAVYRDRRRLMQGLAAGLAGSLLGCDGDAEAKVETPAEAPPKAEIAGLTRWPQSTTEPRTSFRDATHYNNFYEFGTDKDDPAEYSSAFKPKPWTVEVAGDA